jgi:hypothetical protein
MNSESCGRNQIGLGSQGDVSQLHAFFSRDFVESYEETLETLQWLHDALSETGILVASMGFASQGNSPAVKVGMAQGFLDSLLQVGFAAVRDYEEVRIDWKQISRRHKWACRMLVALFQSVFLTHDDFLSGKFGV